MPSQVLAQADVLDYVVMDVALAWERYHRERERAKQAGGAPPAPDIPLNKLQEMMEKVKR